VAIEPREQLEFGSEPRASVQICESSCEHDQRSEESNNVVMVGNDHRSRKLEGRLKVSSNICNKDLRHLIGPAMLRSPKQPLR